MFQWHRYHRYYTQSDDGGEECPAVKLLSILPLYQPEAVGAAQGHHSLLEGVAGVVHDGYQPG